MKIKVINGIRCRLIAEGVSQRGDYVLSPEDYHRPFKTDRCAIISDDARRSGQGHIYRPIKPSKPKKVKPWGSFKIKPKRVSKVKRPKNGSVLFLDESKNVDVVFGHSGFTYRDGRDVVWMEYDSFWRIAHTLSSQIAKPSAPLARKRRKGN